jgi:hypothetical protein
MAADRRRTTVEGCVVAAKGPRVGPAAQGRRRRGPDGRRLPLGSRPSALLGVTPNRRAVTDSSAPGDPEPADGDRQPCSGRPRTGGRRPPAQIGKSKLVGGGRQPCSGRPQTGGRRPTAQIGETKNRRAVTARGDPGAPHGSGRVRQRCSGRRRVSWSPPTRPFRSPARTMAATALLDQGDGRDLVGVRGSLESTSERRAVAAEVIPGARGRLSPISRPISRPRPLSVPASASVAASVAASAPAPVTASAPASVAASASASVAACAPAYMSASARTSSRGIPSSRADLPPPGLPEWRRAGRRDRSCRPRPRRREPPPSAAPPRTVAGAIDAQAPLG